jgi:hypothetical protein
MRLSSITIAPLVTCLLVAGWDGPQLGGAPSTPDAAPLDWFVALTSRIDTTITLGAWLRANPGGTVSDSVPAGAPAEEICRTTRSRIPVEGRTGFLWALFDVPDPASTDRLPAATSDIAERICRLRAFWLQIEEPDSVRAHDLALALGRRIRNKFGRGDARVKMGGRGTDGWLDPRTWRGPGTTLVVGVSPPEIEHVELPPPPESDSEEVVLETRKTDSVRVVAPRTVSLVAYTPHSGLDEAGSDEWEQAHAYVTEEEEWSKNWVFEKADSAIVHVPIATVMSDLMQVIHAVRNFGSTDPVPGAGSALVRAVKTIHDRAPSLGPAQRAALLLAGDLALSMAAPAFETDSSKSSFRRYKALTAAGAEYGPETYMIGYPYTRSWLWDAYRLDSLGNAGRAALVELLATGWKTEGGCGTDVDQIGLVIEHGEAAMRRGDKDPLIPYYVGIAYQDRFSLARGNYYEGYADPMHYEPKAEESRLLAIERLRQALLTLKQPHLRRDASRKVMRLLLSKPSQPRYFCFDN